MRLLLIAAVLATAPLARAQGVLGGDAPPTRADTLRGTVTPERAWWDVTYYDLDVAVEPVARTIRGQVGISYRVLQPALEMQIDLQEPLAVDAVEQDGAALAWRREGNAVFVRLASPQRVGSVRTVTVRYHGTPRVARNAPWDGGFVWAQDSLGRPHVATAVQGLGASAWWPVKDSQTDEPDSQRVAVTVPDPLTNVSNGRLRRTTPNGDGTTTFEWFVANPINTYNVALNIGRYAHFSDTYASEAGPLTLDFYPLALNEARARRQFAQTAPMLACFERWFGPFPWPEDGFKLVETPFLGMEHQSAIAYGNEYQNGYLGRDLSGTGTGLTWDYILVHESGHEWWGNSLTSEDIADMWVHESFTTYSENLYVECQQGRDAGAAYVIGQRESIQNDAPIVGQFGVNREGSGDMYFKGANVLHTVRQLVGDDERWRQALRGLQQTYRHQTVTGMEVRDFLAEATGVDLAPVFEQYLETTRIPALEIRLDGPALLYRWANVVPGFAMPVEVTLAGRPETLRPTRAWQSMPAGVQRASEVLLDPDYFVTLRATGK